MQKKFYNNCVYNISPVSQIPLPSPLKSDAFPLSKSHLISSQISLFTAPVQTYSSP